MGGRGGWVDWGAGSRLEGPLEPPSCPWGEEVRHGASSADMAGERKLASAAHMPVQRLWAGYAERGSCLLWASNSNSHFGSAPPPMPDADARCRCQMPGTLVERARMLP